MTSHPMAGIYAAAVTPINLDGSIAIEEIPRFLSWLSKRGCHGALILGTTGEGPSFSTEERIRIFQASVKVREEKADFRLLAGTGTPSLEETILLTKSAFDNGFDGVVVLPPYYFHQATDNGLFTWYQELINRSVPQDGYLFGYHFPAQSGVPIPLSVISRLKKQYPIQFAGFKDSTKEAEYAQLISSTLDGDPVAFVGNDIFLSQTLRIGGSGCITAMCNLSSPTLRKIWNDFQNGMDTQLDQDEINKKRYILNDFRPFPATIKFLLAEIYGFPVWSVKFPLTPLGKDDKDRLVNIISQGQGW
jgi:4-hydroxy-tetrahydrodipicolinate synthase